MSEFDGFIASLTEEQKKAFIQALSKSIDTKQTESILPTGSAPEVERFIIPKADKGTRRKEPVRARKNEWQDEGEFRDIDTPNVERTPRTRKPHKKIDVDCSVCGRSFKTDPRYVYGEYHRCSRCTGR